MRAVDRWFADGCEETLRYNYPLNENSVVFDIGAFEGAWSKKIWQKYHCKVYSFEPVPEFYEKAKQNISGTSIILLNYAVGVKDMQAKINLKGDGSSFISEGKSCKTVEVRSICGLIEKFDLGKVDLIKLNVEGYEYLIMENIISNNLVGFFDHYQIQFHGGVPNAEERRSQIRKVLSKTHEEKYNYPLVWEGWSVRKA
jgi:FkbM family methyltransferase